MLMKWVSGLVAVLILGVALWLFGSTRDSPLAPANEKAVGNASEGVEPAVAEAAVAQRTDVEQEAPTRRWWEEIIAKAPRHPVFSKLPLGEGPQIHYVIENVWRRSNNSCNYWQVRLDELLQDEDVNPGRSKPSPETMARLTQILQPFALSLNALQAGLTEQLAEAFHRQAERGGYEVVLKRPPEDAAAEQEDMRAATARIESVAGKLEQDHFRIGVSVIDPLRSVLLWATAQSAPDAFATFAEIKAVRSRAREAIKFALAGH